jgi:hypothetical protein
MLLYILICCLISAVAALSAPGLLLYVVGVMSYSKPQLLQVLWALQDLQAASDPAMGCPPGGGLTSPAIATWAKASTPVSGLGDCSC